jgi:RNA polymerase sigma-70 factor (ECF subfamily)
MLVLYMSFIDDEIHRRLFEEIYMTYRKQMFLVARAVLSNDSDAEDAVHDVFLKIAKSQMQKIGSIQEAADVRSYLLKATKHQAIDHLRKRQRQRTVMNAEREDALKSIVELSDNQLVDMISNGIAYDCILRVIASLDDIYRDTLYAHFVLELSIPETASLLNCKTATAKQRLVRGKKLLQKQLLEEEKI